MRARHHTESNVRSFDGQIAPLIHFEVLIDGKSVILQCNFSPVRHFRLFEKGTLVKTILASHVHEVYQDPNTTTQIMVSLDFTASSMTLTKKKLMEMGTSLTLKVDSTSVNERDRMWQFLRALVEDDYDLACMQYHWPNVPTLKEGLSKKKGKHIGGHSIWLVLHPNRLLMFKKSGDEVPASVLLLTEVNVDALGESAIVIHLRSRTYELSFTSPQEAEEWRIAIRCEIDLTTQLRPQHLPKKIHKPKTASISTKFDLSNALEASFNGPIDPNACGLPGCINLREPSIDFCSKHANLQAKKVEKEETAKKEKEQKVREEEEELRLKLIEEATNNPIFWKQAVEAESGERFYYNQAAKVSQYARPLCLLAQDKVEALQWTEMKDVEGRRAWHNIKTGVTTKTRPECLGRDPVMSFWKEALSETGEKYWYNKQLMQSTYENPFLEELKRQERELLEAPACPPSMNDEKLRKELREQQSTIHNLTAQIAEGQLRIMELTNKQSGNEVETSGGYPSPPPYPEETQTTISNLTKQVSDSTLSIQSLRKQAADAQISIKQLTSQVAESQLTILQLNKQVVDQQHTIQQLNKQIADTSASAATQSSHIRQVSGSVAQKLAEAQATIAQLTMQLAEANKQIVKNEDAYKQSKLSVDIPTTPSALSGQDEGAFTSRLDRLEEQNRQLMAMLQTQSQQRAVSPPAREPPARPAPRASRPTS